MLKGIKVRLYPNKLQQEMLDKHFGCCRFVYNAALNYKTYIYNNYKLHKSKIDIINELPNLKEEYPFLKEIKAECLQNTITNLDYAFNNFYKSGKGFPKFKSKKYSNQTFTQNQSFIVKDNKITFYSNALKFKCSDRDRSLVLNNIIKKITYSKNKAGQYFASVLMDVEISKLPLLTKEIGIDLGITNFLVTSDKKFIENPKCLNKSLKRIKTLNQKHALKKKGSNNKEKSRLKLAKAYNKVSNQRNHFLHNLSSKLINENQVIYTEDLNITSMLKNKELARHISDCSWGSFILMLEYKSLWYGREVKRIDRFYPSSKTCSNCKTIKKDLTLSDRIYKCNHCSLEIDRDYNASLNILTIGMNQSEVIKKASLEKEEIITVKI